jgi:integrase
MFLSGYLFSTSGGNPVEPPNFYMASWRPMVRKAQMPEKLTYHKLRHGAASLLLNEGVPIPVVSRYLGHANPGITMKVYAHMIDGTSHVAAAAMDSILG